MIKLDAHAKINLALRITGTEGAFHTLESVVASVSLADRMTLEPAPRNEIVFTSGSAPSRCDNAMRALDGMSRMTGQTARIAIEKRIPDRAGLGGSASEAAGIIRLYCEYARRSPGEPEIAALAAACGSDVPVLLNRGFFRVSGRGERVERIPCGQTLHVALLRSGEVSTEEAFRLSDSTPRAGGDAGPLIEALRQGVRLDQSMIVNDLLPAASVLCPSVPRLLDALKAHGAYAVGMTGSGAACFGLFGTKEEAEFAANGSQADFKAVCTTLIEL